MFRIFLFPQVFMKESLGYDLDARRNDVVARAVVRIQCLARTFLQRQRYQRTRRASIVLQAAVRRWIARYGTIMVVVAVRLEGGGREG